MFDESAPTFAENAAGKALHYSHFSETPVIADDSGLVVGALGGAPGVRSARYAGPQASDADRIAKLLGELRKSGSADRSARFVCVIAVAERGQIQCVLSAAADGEIHEAARGATGFGYDPIFYFPPLAKTFAEMSREEKNLHSHRGQAFRKVQQSLGSLPTRKSRLIHDETGKVKKPRRTAINKATRREALVPFGQAAATHRAPGATPKRVAAILAKLDEAYPNATCALEHDNVFQLLIATILSAQCTDVRVNEVTRTLFKKYRKPEDFAWANPRELETDIRPTGFFRNKTKSIMGASKKIVEEFSGKVPRTMEELLTLPGVARKTANVVLGCAFNIASGIVVDTHVQRLSQRLDLTKNTEPKKIEQDLMEIIPKDKWIIFSHQLIWHGRRVCIARKPRCVECTLEHLCYSKDKTI